MSRQLTCRFGHQWLAGDDSGGGVCPECGATAVTGEGSGDALLSNELPPPPKRGRIPPPVPRPDPPSKTLPEQFGRYRIERQLGQGGMGAVYLAYDEQLDRRVALKIPHFSYHQDPNILERFVREARAAATLEHPNICAVYDVGQIDGVHFITMAYVDGQTLASLIQANPGALPQAGVSELVRKLALALAEAHERGVVHRDLKPANVMVNNRHEPVIMDFGLARRGGGSDPQITAEGALMGTPGYMSPEQVAGDQTKIGPATDIYALGVILYELLTRRRPFEGSTGEVLSQIATKAAPPLSEFRADVDPRLSQICLKALQKRIEDRFASMRDFAAALWDWLQTAESVPGDSAATRLMRTRDDQPAATDTGQKTSSYELAAQLLANLAARIESGELGTHPEITASPRRRVPWWIWTGGAAALVALAIFAVRPFLRSPAATSTPVTIHVDNTYINVVFYLDGKRIDRDALNDLKLAAGRHELVVKRDGVELKRKVLEVTDDGPQKFELEPITAADVARAKQAAKPPARDNPPPNVTVDRALEVWSQPYYRSQVSPLRSALAINGEAVGTYKEQASANVAGRIKPGWNRLKLTTRPGDSVKGENTLSFAFGPAAGDPMKSRTMKPVVWAFYNGGGWKFRDGRYTHQSGAGVKAVDLGFQVYYAGLERETRKIQRGDFVVQSGGYYGSQNPSVTATVFINGTPLTTFGSPRRQAVITDLLKPGRNEIRLVTDRVDGDLHDNDVRISVLGPADYFAGAGATRFRPIAWISAMTGWTRDEKTGVLINTTDPKASRLERVIPLYLPGPVDQVGRFSLDTPQMMVFAERYYSSAENRLYSELTINGKVSGLFTADTQESMAGMLKPNDWNIVSLRTNSQFPVGGGGGNFLRFHLGSVSRAVGGKLRMPRPLWSFQNGGGWKTIDGKLVHRVRPDADEVTLTFHLFHGNDELETRKEQAGGYVLKVEPNYSSSNPSVTATVFINGTGLSSFAGQPRSIVLGPLIRKGMNEFRIVTNRIDNVLEQNDTKITLMGPATYSAATGKYRYAVVKTISALEGWKPDRDSGRLVNQSDPQSNTLERVMRVELK